MADFFQRVWDLVRQIPPGRVATYGQIADLLESPRAARTVGWALHALLEGSDVPWHRVINQEGRISTSQHPQGYGEQRRLLEMEGVEFDEQGGVNLQTYGWDGPPPRLWEELEVEGRFLTSPQFSSIMWLLSLSINSLRIGEEADMHVGFYGHVRQYHNLKEEIDAAILEVLESGQYVQGPTLARFEKELAAYFNMKHAVGCNSGTDALWLAFLALGIGPGDEVITVANTFFATAEAIWFVGAKPVFVEIEPDTCNIDPTRIEAAITDKTKAIVPVHLYGQLANMAAIAEIAERHNLLVVEDCAQSIGAAGDGFAIGELSDAVCISFIIQKNLGTFGDSGGIVTHRDDIVDRMRALRNHGSLKRSYHSMGYNSRLDDLHAGVLSVKLKRIDEWNDRRREIAAMYDEGLKDTGLKLPYAKPGYRHVYHLYVIETDRRDEMLKYLNDAGIDAKTHYPIAIHQQEGYPWGKPADLDVSLPLTEKSAASVISLPMFPELMQEEIDYVIDTVRAWEAK